MTEERLTEFLNRHVTASDEDVLGYIASNFIDIGGSRVGLTVDNAIAAIRFALKRERAKHQPATEGGK